MSSASISRVLSLQHHIYIYNVKVLAIYLLRKSPCGSSVLPSIVGRKRPLGGQPYMTMVYMNLQPPDGTARRSPGGWWSLTPPSHPYPCGRSFSSTGSCCRQQLLFSEVERPVLPGLSSEKLQSPRQAEALLEGQR